MDDGDVARELETYIGFGCKQSGGPGDDACGLWVRRELQRVGFAVERQPISVPWFETEKAELAMSAGRVRVWPQPVVTTTGEHGLSAPLLRAGAAPSAAGGMVLVDLPHGRWSTLSADAIRVPLESAFANGARAAIVVTNGPTGKVVALNAPADGPIFPGPVALMAPEDAPPVRVAAERHERATLHILGRGGYRSAYNLIGRLDRGKANWLVVSTPRSGWFACAGERGPGVAAWLHLARWAARAIRDHNLAFVCNSGHEYENAGARRSLASLDVPPERTALWLHLGANLAARDWHDAVGDLRPLPSADPQRYLVVSPSLLPLAQEAFGGLPGLERPYSADTLSAGELTEIIAAGYPSVSGIFGLHRFHHTSGDDARCVDAAMVEKTIGPLKSLIEHSLAISGMRA